MSTSLDQLREGIDDLADSVENLMGENSRLRTEVEQLRADYKRLRDAAHELYWSANWSADRDAWKLAAAGLESYKSCLSG